MERKPRMLLPLLLGLFCRRSARQFVISSRFVALCVLSSPWPPALWQASWVLCFGVDNFNQTWPGKGHTIPVVRLSQTVERTQSLLYIIHSKMDERIYLTYFTQLVPHLCLRRQVPPPPGLPPHRRTWPRGGSPWWDPWRCGGHPPLPPSSSVVSSQIGCRATTLGTLALPPTRSAPLLTPPFAARALGRRPPPPGTACFSSSLTPTKDFGRSPSLDHSESQTQSQSWYGASVRRVSVS
jgi:hypothetical protein